GGIVMPHWRFSEELLLRWIEPFESEERHVGLAHQRRLAPETHQLWRALADDVGHNHSVDAAGGSARGSIQIGVAIEPQKIHMLVVAPRAGKQANDLRTVAPQDQCQRAAFQ